MLDLRLDRMIEEKADQLGVNSDLLKEIYTSRTEKELNKGGRLDKLIDGADVLKAKRYFERKDGKTYSIFQVKVELSKELRRFVLG